MSKQVKITAFLRNYSQCSNGSPAQSYSPDDFVNIERKKSLKSKSLDKDLSLQVTPESDPNGTLKKRRECPFYKKIPNTNFVVDAFKYGRIPDIEYYFLSHFHSDHYAGLTKNFDMPVVCSQITSKLLINQIGLNKDNIITAELDKPIIINKVKIVLIDANHCPGSVMFLFIFPNNIRYLHTGDFRACEDMYFNDFLIESSIERIYLDTTYLNEKYDFPEQEKAIEKIICLSIEHISSNPKTLIVCGTYTIGKEKVFLSIGERLNLNIWTSKEKMKLLNCINDERINRLMVKNKSEAQIHVLPMTSLNYNILRKNLEETNFEKCVAFKPTGWETIGSKRNDNFTVRTFHNITIYGIPYSEHSSFKELKTFISFFKPKIVIPTVNAGNFQEREAMMKLINSWKLSSKVSIPPSSINY